VIRAVQNQYLDILRGILALNHEILHFDVLSAPLWSPGHKSVSQLEINISPGKWDHTQNFVILRQFWLRITKYFTLMFFQLTFDFSGGNWLLLSPKAVGRPWSSVTHCKDQYVEFTILWTICVDRLVKYRNNRKHAQPKLAATLNQTRTALRKLFSENLIIVSESTVMWLSNERSRANIGAQMP